MVERRRKAAMMGSRLIIRGGILVPVDRPPLVGELLIDQGFIREIAPSLNVVDAEVMDARGMIVLPGFVDTHRHTWQTCARHTCADMMPDIYFGGFLPEKGARYRPEDVYIGNLLGALSALDSGITTLLDWSQIQNSPEHSDAAVEGLRASGIRAIFAHGFPMTDFAAWCIDSAQGHPDDIRRLRRTALSSDDDLVTLAMAGRGPEMASAGVWQSDIRLARELGIRSSIHMGAFPFNGAKRAIAQMHDAGLLGPDLTFIHCCCSSDDELRMMADMGVAASLGINVEQNCQGIGDVPLDRLLAAGIRPSLSGDAETLGCGDMFTQMRQALGHYRAWIGGGHSKATGAPATLASRDVLEFATLRGAEANGLGHKVGTLSAGKSADIILIRQNDLNLMPVSDPIAAIVHGAHPGNVDTVMVAGKVLKRSGELVYADLARVRELARRSQRYILQDA
jgi:5-methylthioadenosine/S-adenosylhomocysteine deaminase